MANLEERVASLEAHTDRHAAAVDGLRNEMTALRNEMTGLRNDVRGEIAGVRADMRELSRRSDRFFIWLAGTQVATLLAVIGVLVGILYQ